MLISKNHLRARHGVSKDESRPVLNVINVTKEDNEIVAAATDGYMLIEVREQTPSADEFPEVNSSPSVNEVRISKKTADNLNGALGKNKLVPVLDYAHVTADGVVTTDLDRSTIFHDKQVEGRFPDYKQLIPEPGSGKATVHINPALLASVLKAFDGVGSVQLELGDPMAPVVLRSVDGDADITGVVMPLKA